MWNPFRKKKEKISMPEHYFEIIYNPEAIKKGIIDEFQKQIRIIKNGRVIEIIPYSSAEVKALTKVYSIPHVDRTKIENKEKFEFKDLDTFYGQTKEIRES